MQRKIFYILIIASWVLPSCKYIAPATSKAITEEQQLEEAKKQNQLLKEQNAILLRIAVALEAKK